MGVECTKCGHAIPKGQFRCGKCGSAVARDGGEDLGGLAEMMAERSATEESGEAAVPDLREPSTAKASEPREIAEASPAPASSRAPAAASKADLSEPAQPAQENAREDAESLPKPPTLPRGTFASEVPAESEAPEPSAPKEPAADENKPAPRPKQAAAETEAAPAPPTTAKGPQGEPPEAEQRPEAQAAAKPKPPSGAQRPPFLASEILREDMHPREPGKRALRRTAHVAATAGLVANLAFSIGSAIGALCAAGMVGLIVATRARLSYVARALTVAGISSVAVVGGTLRRQSLLPNRDDAALAAVVVLLATTLWFRSWYRGSALARGLLGGAVLLAASWAIVTSHRGLLVLGFSWQSWLPALVWYLFCLLCLLAVLGFMGDETTGGCTAWALSLSAWYGVFSVMRYALEAETLSPSLHDSVGTLGLAQPAFAAPLAVALGQLLAHFVGRKLGRRSRGARSKATAPAERVAARYR